MRTPFGQRQRARARRGGTGETEKGELGSVTFLFFFNVNLLNFYIFLNYSAAFGVAVFFKTKANQYTSGSRWGLSSKAEQINTLLVPGLGCLGWAAGAGLTGWLG